MVLTLTAAGCSGGSSDRDPASGTTQGESSGDLGFASPRPGVVYQRTIVFLAEGTDAAMYAAWDFESRTAPDSVHREIRGWLGRAGDWAQFAQVRWSAGASRAPWRIVPRQPVRLVVGEKDAVRELYYEEGPRGLSVRIGAAVAEWNEPEGDSYRLSQASVLLADQSTDGLAIDISVAAEAEDGLAGEWALLTGPGGFAFLLVGEGGRGRYRSWGRHGDEEPSWPDSWPDVRLEWAATRSFERVRRDVPVLWRFESPGGELAGEFESVSSHVQALADEGVVRPVLAVYEVAGEVVVGGERIAVAGFVRHMQR